MNRKSKTAVILLGLLLNLIILPAQAQKAEDILEKMIKATGGREALAAIKDTTIRGTIEIIQFGATAPMTIYQKEPNKYRLEMEIMGFQITQVYDGQKALMTNPQTGEIMELPPEQAKSVMKQALGNDSILHPDKYGISYAYKGEETVDGKKCLVLEQTFQDGDIVTVYLDAETYLPYKNKYNTLSQSGTEIEGETLFSDYRQVGNTVVAHSMVQLQAGAESARITINEVIYNSGIDDALFVLK